MEWRSLPPLPSLRAFAAYAEHGSVQSAGEVLNVSHAAISQQIRNLERHLGITLLDRSARQARLTPEGTQLAEAVQAGFEQIAASVAALSRAEEVRPLHITTTPSFAAGWLMPRLAHFRAEHSGIDLMLDANPALRDPAPGGVDVAIRFGFGDWPGLRARLLLPTRRIAVATPDFLNTGRPTELEDLADYPVLQEAGTSETTDWLERHGVRNAGRAGLMVLPGATTLDAARAGQGILVTASSWVEADLAAGRLVELFTEEQEGMGYYLVTADGLNRSAVSHFVKWALRTARKERKVASGTQHLT